MMFTRRFIAKDGHPTSPFFRYLTRHALLLVVFILVATGAIGGSILGLSTFASGPCRAGERSYSVRWGDTLGAISARYRTSVKAVANRNAIYNVNFIYVGEHLCIAGSGGAVSGGGTSTGSTTVVFRNGYVGVAQQAALNAGIPASLFIRQINQESGFNPYARSWAGAIGIAQFMPGTAASLGINPYNPYQSLSAAARLMASYNRQYGSYAAALGAYNAGPGAVNRAFSCGNSWMYCLPAETQNYIRVIMNW